MIFGFPPYQQTPFASLGSQEKYTFQKIFDNQVIGTFMCLMVDLKKRGYIIN